MSVDWRCLRPAPTWTMTFLHDAILRGAWLHRVGQRNPRRDDLGNQVNSDERGGADLQDVDLTGADLRGASIEA